VRQMAAPTNIMPIENQPKVPGAAAQNSHTPTRPQLGTRTSTVKWRVSVPNGKCWCQIESGGRCQIESGGPHSEALSTKSPRNHATSQTCKALTSPTQSSTILSSSFSSLTNSIDFRIRI
jgi:hypothetical protein